MKTEERNRARELRSREGRSVKEIARILGVAQSSVSKWTRDVVLTEEQRHALGVRGRHSRSRAWSAHFRERRRAFQHEGRVLARRRDPGHIAGCMLYWAEGSRSRNSIQFTNSDPAMVAFFADFLRAFYSLSDDESRIECNLFADHAEDQSRIERFWLETLGLPATCLRKSTVNVYSKHSMMQGPRGRRPE